LVLWRFQSAASFQLFPDADFPRARRQQGADSILRRQDHLGVESKNTLTGSTFGDYTKAEGFLATYSLGQRADERERVRR
jgi:hypothetical protein